MLSAKHHKGEVSVLKISIILSLMCLGLLSFAQNVKLGNPTATTQINVRIPAFAVIDLADNNSQSIASTKLSESKKSIKNRKIPATNVVSNQDWTVNVKTEQYFINDRGETLPGNIKGSINDARLESINYATRVTQLIYTTTQN